MTGSATGRGASASARGRKDRDGGESSKTRNNARGQRGALAKSKHGNLDGGITDGDTVDTPKANEPNNDSDDVTLRTNLDLSKHALPPIEQLIETLARFPNVQRLDLSDMQPSQAAGNPKGLTSMAWIGKAATLAAKRAKKPKAATTKNDGVQPTTFGDRLSWLKVSDNAHLGEIDGDNVWEGLDRLQHLAVMNASACAICVPPPPPTLLSWASSLCALILGHNALHELPHFPSMPLLNTIVLSHNQLTMLPHDLPANVPSLKKLSITHNRLEWKDGRSPLPDFSLCSHLREVRISGNVGLLKLPDTLSSWGRGVGSHKRGTGLEIFEAADCGLTSWGDIAPLLKVNVDESSDVAKMHPDRIRIRGLNSLLLKGNLIATDSFYKVKLCAAHPSLKVLDNVRLQEKTKAQAVQQSIPARGKPTEAEARPPTAAEHDAEPRAVTDKPIKSKSRESEGRREGSGQQAADTSAVEQRKKHKRGGRGGRNKDRSVEETRGNASKAAGSIVKASTKSQKDKLPSKTAATDTARSAGATRKEQTRAEPVVNKAKIEKHRGNKKRKAWDEAEDTPQSKKRGSDSIARPKEIPAAGEVKPASTDSDNRTSVAGIVDLTKSRGAPKQSKQIGKTGTQETAPSSSASATRRPGTLAWTTPRPDLSLGQGGAWD